jgi:transposase
LRIVIPWGGEWGRRCAATIGFAVVFHIDLEKRIRADHPLRVIRQIANAALNSLSDEFQKLYSSIGRESIPPERLMRALLLQGFYSIP